MNFRNTHLPRGPKITIVPQKAGEKKRAVSPPILSILSRRLRIRGRRIVDKAGVR